jgi:hypothetical protein
MESIMKIRVIIVLILLASAGGYEFDPNDFAVEVVSYVPGTGIPTDSYTGQPYSNPLAALGRPAIDTLGDGHAAPVGQPVPVVPVYPPWRAEEVVSIGFRGHLILKFAHPVSDDMNNPYGKDLIVFGNSLQQINGTDYWLTGDPRQVVTRNKGCTREAAVISVSQDGQSWFTFTMDPAYRENPDFSDPNFPGQYGLLGDFFADGFAPTLGRVYEPCTGDPNCIYWGAPTDPTLPLDPSVLEIDLRNTTLAEIALLYRSSAGGTALDISQFDLPPDPQTGRKWIQYIRFDNPRNSGATPEIDAVADAACCGDWKRPCIPGDINRDSRVDLEDLMELSQHWLIGVQNDSGLE